MTKNKDLGAHGENGQIEFNGSQYELTRGDIELLAVALDIVKPVAKKKTRAFRLSKIFAQLADRNPETTKPVRQMIEINVEGGVIQDVLIPKGSNVGVVVRDYDVDGIEDESLSTDSSGDECVISEYKA